MAVLFKNEIAGKKAVLEDVAEQKRMEQIERANLLRDKVLAKADRLQDLVDTVEYIWQNGVADPRYCGGPCVKDVFSQPHDMIVFMPEGKNAVKVEYLKYCDYQRLSFGRDGEFVIACVSKFNGPKSTEPLKMVVFERYCAYHLKESISVMKKFLADFDRFDADVMKWIEEVTKK